MNEFDEAQFGDLREKYDKLNQITAPGEVKGKIWLSITAAQSDDVSRRPGWHRRILARREQAMSLAAALGAVAAVSVIVFAVRSRSPAQMAFTAGTTPPVKLPATLTAHPMPLSGLDATVLWLAIMFGAALILLASVYGEEHIRRFVARVIQPTSVLLITCLLGLVTLGTSLYLNHSANRLLVGEQEIAEGELLGGVNAFVASGLAHGATQHADAAYWGLGQMTAAANGLDTVQGVSGLDQFLEQATRDILGQGDHPDALSKAHDEHVIAVLQQSFTPLWLSPSGQVTPARIQIAIDRVYAVMTPAERRTFEHM